MPREDVSCIGDSKNDISIFRASGLLSFKMKKIGQISINLPDSFPFILFSGTTGINRSHRSSGTSPVLFL
ncbi:MAG: hypothetical protein ACI4TF_06685 [Oliverpabstia sp.]